MRQEYRNLANLVEAALRAAPDGTLSSHRLQETTGMTPAVFHDRSDP